MNLCDPFVWLAIVLPSHHQHPCARRWWENLSGEKALFCRSTQQIFLRLLTTPEILKPHGINPRTQHQAWKIYHQLRADPCTGFLNEPAGLEELWIALSLRDDSTPKLWMDAYLSTLAIKCGCALVTFDPAFRQFETDGLRVKYLQNPA